MGWVGLNWGFGDGQAGPCMGRCMAWCMVVVYGVVHGGGAWWCGDDVWWGVGELPTQKVQCNL